MNIWPVSYPDIPENIREQLNRPSLFGTQSFAQLWRSTGGTEIYWLVEKNGEGLLVLPAIEYGRWPLKRLQAMPDGLYCAIIKSADYIDKIEPLLQKLWASITSNYARVFLSDFEGIFPSVVSDKQQTHSTLLIDISSPQWQPPDKKILSEIRKAQRDEINVETFDIDRHLDGFLSLMSSSEKRHGRQPKYSPAFFTDLAALAKKDKRVDWKYVAVNGEPAASHINLIEGDMLLNWQIYFDKAHSQLKPNQFLIFDAVRRWQPEGVRTLNLGSTPQSAAGVKSHKEKWGGREYSYSTLTHRSGLGWLI